MIYIRGGLFNEKHKKKEFQAFLYDSPNYRNYQCELGLNVCKQCRTSWDDISKKGFNFFEKSKSYLHWENDACSLAVITIPNDAYVCKDETKDNITFKTNKMFITEIIDFKYLPDKFWIDVVKKGEHGMALRYVIDQTEKLCKKALEKNGLALQHVNIQTEKLCEIAILQDAMALQYVKDQTHEICVTAVKQNGLTLQYVKQQNEIICKLAIAQNSEAVRYVKG